MRRQHFAGRFKTPAPARAGQLANCSTLIANHARQSFLGTRRVRRDGPLDEPASDLAGTRRAGAGGIAGPDVRAAVGRRPVAPGFRAVLRAQAIADAATGTDMSGWIGALRAGGAQRIAARDRLRRDRELGGTEGDLRAALGPERHAPRRLDALERRPALGRLPVAAVKRGRFAPRSVARRRLRTPHDRTWWTGSPCSARPRVVTGAQREQDNAGHPEPNGAQMMKHASQIARLWLCLRSLANRCCEIVVDAYAAMR